MKAQDEVLGMMHFDPESLRDSDCMCVGTQDFVLGFHMPCLRYSDEGQERFFWCWVALSRLQLASSSAASFCFAVAPAF